MLREGTFITGIGELTLEKNGLKLQAPSDGNPYYLTALPIASLIRKLDDEKRIYRYGKSMNLAYFQCCECLLTFSILQSKVNLNPQNTECISRPCSLITKWYTFNTN
jgi:hypothetical protein